MLDDPAGQGLAFLCPIRDAIRRRVDVLIEELAPRRMTSREGQVPGQSG